MNELTTTRPQLPSQGFNQRSDMEGLSAELAKMLGLVAPITMSADQQAIWIASAVDALKDIRASEVVEISMEVRRTVTRPSQIVPEIAKLVAEHRSSRSHASEQRKALEAPPVKIPVMDRRGQPMTEDDTAELNATLEKLGAKARYRADGSRYMIDA